jgi:hypothetical protein
MKKSTLALSAALVVTNAAWLYAFIDAGVSYSYLADSYDHAKATATQAIALLPVVAKPGVSRTSVLAVARQGRQADDVFEKDGMTWIGDIGLRFDSAGTLVEARPAADPL